MFNGTDKFYELQIDVVLYQYNNLFINQIRKCLKHKEKQQCPKVLHHYYSVTVVSPGKHQLSRAGFSVPDQQVLTDRSSR
jgi:hypothetical protein